MVIKDLKKFRREIEEGYNEFRKNCSLTERVILELIPAIEGALLGGLGRLSGFDELPLVPITMDAMTNMSGYFTPKGLWTLAKYGAGVAAVYADKIIPAVQQYFS